MNVRKHLIPSASAGVVWCLIWSCLIGLPLPVEAQKGSTGRPATDEQPSLQWTAPDKQVYDALEKPTSVDFFDTPLEEALELIAEQASMPVLIDGPALDVIAVDSGQPITFRRKGTSWRSTMRAMLRSLELTYVIRNGALIITSIEEAEQECSTHVLPIGDLIQDADSLDKLVSILTEVVRPDSWEEAGGNGTMSVLDGLLVVRQTAPVLRELCDTLAMMRRKRDPQQRILISPSHQFEAKFAATMSKPGKLDFFETPLEECVQVIGEIVELPVGIDLAACDLLGVDPGTPITFGQKGMSIGRSVEEMLRELDLVAIPRDEAVEFTALEEVEQELTIRGYFVGDIVDTITKRSGDVNRAASELIDTVTSTIEPDMWCELGGVGTIQYWSGNQLLLVAHSYATHEKIGPLLGQIAAAQSGSRGSIQEWSERPVTEVYFLPQVDGPHGSLQPSQVADLIRLHLPDISWQRDNLQTLTARVIVRQVPSVQRRVRKLINKFQYGVENPAPAGGGASGGGVFRLAPTAGVTLRQAPY